jgi:transcriptional regulator with XRE-family HTH domain
VAVAAGISVETLRKIETGRIPTPAFFTVVGLARVLNLSLDDLSVDVFPDRAAAVTKAS